MSRFLFTTLPTDDFGLLTRSLPIARELKLRGHEVAFCHPAKGPQTLIGEAGFENLLPKEPLCYLIADSSLSGLIRLLGKGRPLRTAKIVAGIVRDWAMHRTDDIFLITNADFARANIAGFAAIMNSYNADAVVDFWNPWASVAAKTLKKPLIAVIQWQQHPQNPGMTWWTDPPSRITVPVSGLNEMLGQYGLPPIRNWEELTTGDRVLMVGIPELDPISESAEVTYLGPVLWQNPRVGIPEWIDELETGKPVVWIYPGKLRYGGCRRTPIDSEVVLQASIEALAKENVQVVLSTGHQGLPRSYKPLPDNFRFEPFVPGLTMAGRSDLMIHHGGYGSCQTGLYAGVPQVIIPTFLERESNARRVAAQGAAEVVMPTSDESGINKRVDSVELAARVRQVLTTPSYRDNARRISARLKEYGGATTAARVIEEMVKSGNAVKSAQAKAE